MIVVVEYKLALQLPCFHGNVQTQNIGLTRLAEGYKLVQVGPLEHVEIGLSTLTKNLVEACKLELVGFG